MSISPLSAPVLAAAALVSAPALWASLVTAAAPIEDGLIHFIVALGVCWLGLEIFTALVGPSPQPVTDRVSEGSSSNSESRDRTTP